MQKNKLGVVPKTTTIIYHHRQDHENNLLHCRSLLDVHRAMPNSSPSRSTMVIVTSYEERTSYRFHKADKVPHAWKYTASITREKNIYAHLVAFPERVQIPRVSELSHQEKRSNYTIKSVASLASHNCTHRTSTEHSQLFLHWFCIATLTLRRVGLNWFFCSTENSSKMAELFSETLAVLWRHLLSMLVGKLSRCFLCARRGTLVQSMISVLICKTVLD